jgi:hypothetical protein
MISVYLLVLAGLVSLAATRVLPGAGWVYRSPRSGLTAWYAVLVVVASSVAEAAVSLAVSWPGARVTVCAWWAWCVQALGGGHGPIAGLAGGVLTAALVVVAVRAARAGRRLWQTLASRRRTHATMLAVLGRQSAELGATVVDSPLPVAYVLPGRRSRVVITTGAVDALTPRELAAVLAHERAHARGRHHLLADAVRLFAAAFPTAVVFSQARQQIDRLVELRADDVAAVGHARLDLARALVAMAEAGIGQASAVPVGAVAATGGDALERVQRLLDPPPVLSTLTRTGLGVALTGLASTPLVLMVLAGLFPVLAGCPPMA